MGARQLLEKQTANQLVDGDLDCRDRRLPRLPDDQAPPTHAVGIFATKKHKKHNAFANRFVPLVPLCGYGSKAQDI